MNTIPDRPIAVLYRTNDTQSLQKMTINLLETVSLKDRLPADRGSLIGLKPNLVVSKPASSGATTHPEIVEGIIQYLQSLGYDNIIILEGAWVGDRTTAAFRVCGYEELANRYNVRLMDTQKDSVHKVSADGYSLTVCDIMQDLDFFINVPVLKGHCQTYYTGSLKNMKGCIPDSEKRRYHSKGLHEPIARLNTVIKQDFIVMDGICGDPTFEEGGSPSSLNRILCSHDPVLLDSYACTQIQLDYSDIGYIGRCAELGVGEIWSGEMNQILEINTPSDDSVGAERDPMLETLSNLIDEQDACSSCYAALIAALREYPELTADNRHFAIGRAFRKKGCSGEWKDAVGIGRCTAQFTRFVPGCPPSPEDIAGKIL